MNFLLLRDEQQLQQIRETFPLLREGCLPTLPLPAADTDGSRYAVVCDRERTVLAVLRQTYPYRGGTVAVVSLVVAAIPGLRRLLRFLRHFVDTVRPWIATVSLTPRHTQLFLHGGVTEADVFTTLTVGRVLFFHTSPPPPAKDEGCTQRRCSRPSAPPDDKEEEEELEVPAWSDDDPGDAPVD
jgi:phage tail protein X